MPDPAPTGQLACVNCAATIDEGEAKDAGWRYWSDGVGELHLFCQACAEIEFGADAPASSRRRAG